MIKYLYIYKELLFISIMGKLTNKIVKHKKIQKVGENLMVLLPKTWLKELSWNRNTQLVLEFLPHRKLIILSENEKIGDPIQIAD